MGVVAEVYTIPQVRPRTNRKLAAPQRAPSIKTITHRTQAFQSGTKLSIGFSKGSPGLTAASQTLAVKITVD
jgi:hypothetical protein